MNIDKQGIAAVRALEALGYIYRRGGAWLAAAGCRHAAIAHD